MPFFLTSDSVAAVATSFEKGGVVLIAGTGSACRLLKTNGDVHGVGGWGHLIGDGGGGFWIAMRSIRQIFDVEDGLLCGPDENFANELGRVAPVKKALLCHFNLDSKLGLLDVLYNPNFDKSFIASFCKKLAELALAGDNFSVELFESAGEELAKHLISVSRHFDDEMFVEGVPVVLIGSVFESWRYVKNGFEKQLREANGRITKPERRIRKILLYQLASSTAVGAAILGSKLVDNVESDIFKKLQSKNFLQELVLCTPT